jgi:hypothetical protein
MIVPDVPLGSGINSLPTARFATERDEVAVTGQSVLAASGHFLLAAHSPRTRGRFEGCPIPEVPA